MGPEAYMGSLANIRIFRNWTASLACGVVVSALLPACAPGPSDGGAKPNVIIILTDDQGYGDMSAHGNPILETPNLDRLHDESIRLTDFHVAAVCTPTRGELMTGLYALRNKAGMVPAARNLMRRDVPTMPEVFADGGYATGLFGKWHLGDTYPHRPLDRGFQRAVWHKGWGFASEIEYDNDYYYTRYFDQEEVRHSDRFCTATWFDAAMEWMGDQADAGRPFFTYLALNTPHYPFNALASHYQRYGQQVDDPLLAHFFGLITIIDENVARLDRWLEGRGLRENTILVFMNDNGTAKGEAVFNAGMRGKKGSAYDGGHRAICFVRWPGGGLGDPREIDYASHVTDVLPTLADLAGLPLPPDASLDGASLASLLRSPTAERPDRKIIVQYGGRHRPTKYGDAAVLWNDWRLVGESELYDIREDPGQVSNVAGEHPEVLGAMRDHYEAYWDQISASVEEVEPLVVRSEPGTFTDLTSNGWIEVDCENRTRVAETCGPARGGVWQLEAEAAGEYEVELRRWPFHMDRGLVRAGPGATIGGVLITPGKALPIRAAALSVNGGQPSASAAEEGAAGVRFEVSLAAGRNTLQGWFRGADGGDLTGAYYARVRPLD